MGNVNSQDSSFYKAFSVIFGGTRLALKKDSATSCNLANSSPVSDLIRSLGACLMACEVDVRLLALKTLTGLLDNKDLTNRLKLLKEFQQILPIIEQVITEGWNDADKKAMFLSDVGEFFYVFCKHDALGISMLTGPTTETTTLLPIFLDMLGHSNNDVQTSTILAVFVMLNEGSMADVQKILDAGFQLKVPMLLGDGTTWVTKRCTMKALNRIFDKGSKEHFEMLMQDDVLNTFVPAVVQIFDGHQLDIKLDAADLLIVMGKAAARRGLDVDYIVTRLKPYQVTPTLLDRVAIFKIREGETIKMNKYALYQK